MAPKPSRKTRPKGHAISDLPVKKAKASEVKGGAKASSLMKASTSGVHYKEATLTG